MGVGLQCSQGLPLGCRPRCGLRVALAPFLPKRNLRGPNESLALGGRGAAKSLSVQLAGCARGQRLSSFKAEIGCYLLKRWGRPSVNRPRLNEIKDFALSAS